MSLKARVHEPILARGGSLQRRTVGVLATATVLGGIGVGASLSVGALLLAEVSGNDAISGLGSATFNAGAALAGIPLARLAARRGRRAALVSGSLVAMFGSLVAIYASAIGVWWLLAIGLALVGVASAVQLLSRFAATDLAEPRHRARDLSLVVWAITIGAVVGPNLIGPGEVVGELLGIPPLAGVFVFPFIAQGLAALVNLFGLRPDPLLTARTLAPETGGIDVVREAPVAAAPEAQSAGGPVASRQGSARRSVFRTPQVLVIVMTGVAQAVMVAPMAMTPLHLMHHEGTAELVGLTLSLHIAGMYALSPVFGMLAGRYGRLRVIGAGWVLMLAALILAYYSGPSHLMVQIALTLLGLGWGAVTVASATLLTEMTASAERTRWQGRSDTLMSASGAIAGAVSGLFFAAGGFSFLAFVTGLLLIVGALALLRLLFIARAAESKAAEALSRD